MTILNYEDNMQKIEKISKNNFRKLEKKQKVRIGFINEVIRFYNFKTIEKDFTDKSLFFIIILTITLKNYTEEIKLQESISTLSQNQNDIEQSLLAIAVKIITHSYSNQNVLKVFIYYISRLLILLLSSIDDSDHYISIGKILLKIKEITDKRGSLLKKEEVFPFLKENLRYLGKLFARTKTTHIKKDNQKILISYYVDCFDYLNSEYINLNMNEIKQFVIIKGDKENTNNNNNNNIIISKKKYVIYYMDLVQSLYYFLLLVIKDISTGKSVINELFVSINKEFEQSENKQMQFDEILILSLLLQCQEDKGYKKFIISLFDYLKDKTPSITDFNYYYSIISQYRKINTKDEDLNNRCMSLLAKIFIWEKNESNFTKYLNDIIINNTKNSMKMLFALILKISIEFSHLKNSTKENNILRKMKFIEKYSKHDLFQIESVNNDISFEEKKNKRQKEKNNKNELLLILTNFSKCDIKNKQEYMEFLILILFFNETNFYCEFENDFTLKKIIFSSFLSFLYDFDFLSEFNEEICKDFISLLRLFKYWIETYSIKYFEDSFLIYKFLASLYSNIQTHPNWKTKKFTLKFIYIITMFIFSILKRVYKLPNSFEKIHNEIISQIKNINQQSANELNFTKEENFIFENNNSEKFFSFLLENFKQIKQFDINQISNEHYIQILNVISTKFFGQFSSLNCFYEGQVKSKQINLDDVNLEIGQKSHGKESEVITEGNMGSYGELAMQNENDLSDVNDINDISFRLNEEGKINSHNREKGTKNEEQVYLKSKDVKEFEMDMDTQSDGYFNEGNFNIKL